MPESDFSAEIIDKVLDKYQNRLLRWWLRLKTRVGQLPTSLFLPFFKDWQPGSILEIGCGYGVLANCLSWHFPEAKVQGIDIDAGRIAVASQTRAGRDNVSFLLQDALALSGQDWDCLILVDVIHHVPRKFQAGLLTKCYELLKPGGRLLIRDVDPHANAFKTCLTHIFECLFYREVCKTLSPAQLDQYMKSAGFKQIDVYPDMPASPVFPYVTYMAYKD